MDGVLLVDKPAGPTSHDVVARVRRLTGQRRAGHTGTLDPFATGLLVICLGRATRLARFLSGTDKSYRATIRFGFATDTYDRTGRPVAREGDRAPGAPEPAQLEAALEAFRGVIRQTPPPYSAKKIAGKRAHALARAGEEVKLEPVEVTIHELELVELEGELAVVRLRASSGTYVRSLAHDLGGRLGTGAHLTELRRTRVGEFSVEDAVTLSALEEGTGGSPIPADQALPHLPAVSVEPAAVERLAHGRAPAFREVTTPDVPLVAERVLRIVDDAGRLLAVAVPRPDSGVLQPLVVWRGMPESD